MRKLTSEEFVSRAKTVHGDRYDYSKTSYTGANAKVVIICEEHGEFTQTPQMHTAGQGCPNCGAARGLKSRTKALADWIAHGREKFGDRFDYSKVVETKNCRSKITLICREHGEFTTSWFNHTQADGGGGCTKCANAAKSAAKLLGGAGFAEKAEAVHGQKYDYSKVTYSGTYEPVTIICPTHGEFQQKPINHLQSAEGCPDCARQAFSDKIRLPLDEFIAQARAVHGDKYTYLGSVTGNRWKGAVHHRIVCPTHGEFLQSRGNHLNSAGCPQCSRVGGPLWERDLAEYLRSLGLNVQQNVRILGGKEIDIYLPDQKFGVELHGLYWHTEDFQGAEGHLEKLTRAESQGITLIQVFEDEWRQKKPLVLRLIRQRLGLEPALRARHTHVRGITPAQAKAFHEQHHLQGHAASAAEHLGLFQGDDLIAAVSLGKSRFEDCHELIRYTSIQPVTGGLAKLLKRSSLKGRLVSYADRRWFNGKAYLASGFSPDGFTRPGYAWVSPDGLTRLPRWRFQKRYLGKTLPGATGSEAEAAHSAGYLRIYDCGMARFTREL